MKAFSGSILLVSAACLGILGDPALWQNVLLLLMATLGGILVVDDL